MKPILLLVGLILGLGVQFVGAQTTKEAKPPKHYIRPTLYTDVFAVGKRTLNRYPGQSYGLVTTNLGFYTPLVTHEVKRADSSGNRVLHVVLAGQLSQARPNFSFIDEPHRLYRMSLGVNTIFQLNNRDMFVVSLMPFLAEDRQALSRPTPRLAWMVVYNRTVNEWFSFRLGWARSFVLGGSPNLPVLGMRIGRYDRLHVNLQFPRGYSLEMPFSSKFSIGLFHRYQGGPFVMKDVGFLGADYQKVIFRRREMLTGIDVTVKPSSSWSVFFSSGFATRSWITMSTVTRTSFTGQANLLESESGNLIASRLSNALFVNLGVQVRLGKSRSTYDDYAKIDALYLNHQLSSGDQNNSPIDPVLPYVPRKKEKLKAVQLNDVLDVVDEADAY
jgi:hypothetical protein